ncbi:MAG: NAD(+)/NADH kinase, partial [Panacagrimonas sp.]
MRSDKFMGSFSIVGLIGKRRDPSLNPLIASLCELLQARGCEVLVERSKASSAIDPRLLVETEEIARRADLAIVVGGDGTLLGVGRTLAAAQVPILGINQGRLGFMVDIPPEGMQDAICAVLDGDHDSEERLILSATLERNGEKDRKVRTSVNDVVIRNQATIRMIEFETWMDREFISSHRADGM